MAKQETRIESGGSMVLQLYVSGMSPKSMEAIENIQRLCNEILKDFVLEIIDLYKNPEAASLHQIIFSPSLVKPFPLPRKVVIGTFADPEKVIRGLGLTM